MKQDFQRSTNQGFTMVEAVVAISILAVMLATLGSITSKILSSSLDNTAKIQAAYLAEEGLEVMRLLRDESWSTNIAVRPSGTNFYIHYDGSAWSATSTNMLIGNLFERRIMLSDVRRDSSQRIVESGGNNDPNIKKVTVTLVWNSRGATSTRSLSTYLTNVFDN
jgi:prepilin-type N-terminal cleavage/methylation domain-containing protein